MRPLTLRDPDPTRLAIILAWVRLALYVSTVAATAAVGLLEAWHNGMGSTVPHYVDGINAVLKYLGAGAGATALANFVWTKPTPRHREDTSAVG